MQNGQLMSVNKRNKPQCILHIGMPRTGLTSIQKALYNISESNEFLYPKLDTHNNHSPLIYLLFSEEKLSNYTAPFYGKQSNSELNKLKADILISLKKKLSECKKNIIIFLSEGLIFLSVISLQKLKDFLLEFVSDIKILAYVRSAISFTKSAFKQNAKMGNLKIDLAKPRYEEWFEKFDSIFERENVSLIHFDASTLKSS